MAPTFSPNPQNFTKKDKTKAERRKPEEGDDDHHHNASQLFLNPWHFTSFDFDVSVVSYFWWNC
ncbi:hypothetical protein AXX17_AT2G03510 [Arabidopsis thaliana]|uniref:Uncharacterized protein n=1 Tax=Arabidopsis thaliana TaxID=3702 RepID=A0A178W1Y7_ARATH|nr:hypothetical protein AXX17_AT2G03510 [Arabidopsis thaliana]